MVQILQTETFSKWLRKLKNKQAKAVITERLERLEDGNFGDHKRFDGIGELRIFVGAGYRVYFMERGNEIVILLIGGDKSSQKRDIKKAVEMAKELK